MTNKKVLLFLLLVAVMLAMVSCTAGDPDGSDSPAQTSDETDNAAVLSEALELLRQSERLSDDYESFVQTTQTTSSTDDGNVISSLRTVLKKSGESYSFSQLTEAFNEHGHLTADSLIEMMYDGVGITYYDDSIKPVNRSFGAIAILKATEEEYLSMLLSADSGMLGLRDPEYFKSGSITEKDGFREIVLQYSDAGESAIFEAFGMPLGEGIEVIRLGFTAVIDSEGNAVNTSAEIRMALSVGDTEVKITALATSEYTDINSNSLVDSVSVPDVSLQFEDFYEFSTVSNTFNILKLMSTGNLAFEYERTCELTVNMHPPHNTDAIVGVSEHRGAYDPLRGYSYSRKNAAGNTFKQYGDFKHFYSDTGNGIDGPVEYYYDVTALVDVFREIRPDFFSLEYIKGVSAIEKADDGIKIILDVDDKMLVSRMSSSQYDLAGVQFVINPVSKASVSTKSVEIILSPEGLPLSFSVYFAAAFDSDECDEIYRDTVTFTSYSNVNIEVMP